MFFRCRSLILIAALVVAAGAGCRKSEPGPSPTPPVVSPVETVARVHWLGKKRLATDTNSASFMEIWNLPESAKLGDQTLDKLSLAPWLLLKGDAVTNGAPTALLRPLLDDLIQEESYLEIRSATNEPGELAFAIRLGPERGDLWETNLAAVLESLTGIQPVAAATGRPGWSLRKHDTPKLIELTRAGDWTLVGLAPEQTALLSEFVERIERDGAPFAARATNFWLEAALDFPRISRALSLGWNLPDGWPRIFATVTGEGDGVVTRGQLDFPHAQLWPLEAWNIPTNLVHDQLTSFTALRGIGPWLESLKGWKDLHLGAPPNQFCFWSVGGYPTQMYFAAPAADASNRVHAATEFLVQEGNAWLPTKTRTSFEWAPDFNGAVWTGEPFMSPFLKSVVASGGNFVFGGLFRSDLTNGPPPAELLPQILGRTNLVCYDWELTGARIENWIFTGQLLRMVFDRAGMVSKSAGMAWLRAVVPKLGNCGTVITKTGSNQLSFFRRSHAGFTGIELHWLCDWLESPQFPRGTRTLLVPRQASVLPPED